MMCENQSTVQGLLIQTLLVNFQDMLSCLITDKIFAEEQKLISLFCLYVKAATLRLELFEE